MKESAAGGEDEATRHEESGPPRDLAAEQPFRLGRYTVTRRIGAGGMGLIYLAYDDELGRRVALKLLHARSGEGSLGRSRMLREAQALAKLSHPNVVHIYEVGSVDDRVFLAMEYLSGVTLRAWWAERARGWREVLACHMQAGNGLAAAHAAGLVHRDFKPDNVIVASDGRVRVIDFGLAREGEGVAPPVGESAHAHAVLDISGSTGPLTEAGSLLGTPAYMSPEQLLRGPADARSDQFAFCVVLWEGLFARRPFSARSIADLTTQVFAGPPRAPRGGPPGAVTAVLRRGLAADPTARFPDMPTLLAALDEAAQRGRRRATWGVAASLVLAASAAGYALAGAGADTCDPDAALAGVWDEEARAAAERGLLATGAPFAADAWRATGGRLDAYAAALSNMSLKTCTARAAGELSAAGAELQGGCLELRREELKAVRDLLAGADLEAVRGALQAADGLSPLAPCADLEELRAEASRVLPPRDAALAVRVAEVRVGLAAVKAEQDAGRFAAAKAALEPLLRAAPDIDYPPLRAELSFREGSVRSVGGEYAAARDALLRAFAQAEAARHDDVAASAALALVHLYGVRLREPEAALTWSAVAEAKLDRLHDDSSRRIELLRARGVTLAESDRLEEASVVLEAARDLALRRRDEAPLQRVRVLTALASLRHDQGRFAEAVGLAEEVYETRVELLGPEHPDVAVALHSLGQLAVARHEGDAALDYFRRALAIRERSLGPKHPTIADTMTGLSVATCLTRPHDECLAEMRRALETAEAAYGRDGRLIVRALNNLASELSSGGDAAAAEQLFARALRILEATGDAESGDAALVRYNLGMLALFRGENARAAEDLRRSLELRIRLYGRDHIDVGYAAVHLATALSRLGRTAEAAEQEAHALPILRAHPEAAVAVAHDRLTGASLLWSRDRAAGRALAAAAAERLPLPAAGEPALREEIAVWLREHPL